VFDAKPRCAALGKLVEYSPVGVPTVGGKVTRSATPRRSDCALVLHEPCFWGQKLRLAPVDVDGVLAFHATTAKPTEIELDLRKGVQENYSYLYRAGSIIGQV
jgi:hypothetical protein